MSDLDIEKWPEEGFVELNLKCKIKIPTPFPTFPHDESSKLIFEKYGKTIEQVCKCEKPLMNEIFDYRDDLQIVKDYYNKWSEYLTTLESLIPNEFKVQGSVFEFHRLTKGNFTEVFTYDYKDWNSPAPKDDPMEKSFVNVRFKLPFLMEG
jgi:hypothetical protein